MMRLLSVCLKMQKEMVTRGIGITTDAPTQLAIASRDHPKAEKGSFT